MNPEIQETKKSQILRNFFIIFFLIIVVNTVFLDIVFLKSGNIQLGEEKNSTASQAVQNIAQTNFCPESCLSKINEATSSIKLTQEAPAATVSENRQQYSSIKEYYITFGSGSNATDDWTDVTGL